jgi:hypothetical protein
MTTSDFRGPVEAHRWPEQLTAHVVEPSASPRIHGYAAESDLARHHGFADTLLLALTGELPDPCVARTLEACLVFLAPISVREAPCHAGLLSRICGAREASSIGVMATALAQQAAHVLAEHEDWLAWLQRPQGDPPARFCAQDERDEQSVLRLKAAIDAAGFAVPALEPAPRRMAAMIAVLHACGLTRPDAMISVFVMARLPCCAAEAAYVKAGQFSDYPMGLPPFDYEHTEAT